MDEKLTTMDAIVLLAVVFAVVFLAAWLVSPRLRVWIERPKYRFLADVQSYDRTQRQRRGSPNEPT
jgi:hypothetical protein